MAFPSAVFKSAKFIPASENAWSVGAKTVNGPGPCSVESKSA